MSANGPSSVMERPVASETVTLPNGSALSVPRSTVNVAVTGLEPASMSSKVMPFTGEGVFSMTGMPPPSDPNAA